MITAGQIRNLVSELDDDDEVLISIDVSTHGDDENEAGKRAFADDAESCLEMVRDRFGNLLTSTMCCVGHLNF